MSTRRASGSRKLSLLPLWFIRQFPSVRRAFSLCTQPAARKSRTLYCQWQAGLHQSQALSGLFSGRVGDNSEETTRVLTPWTHKSGRKECLSLEGTAWATELLTKATRGRRPLQIHIPMRKLCTYLSVQLGFRLS